MQKVNLICVDIGVSIKKKWITINSYSKYLKVDSIKAKQTLQSLTVINQNYYQ